MPIDSPRCTDHNLAVLDAVITAVTRSARMSAPDAEDFRQTIYLRLVERDGDVFQRFGGRSSLRTYLFVVVRRMWLDWQNRVRGKWRPCAAARKAGTLGITLDRLLNRDGYALEQAIAYLASVDDHVDVERIRRLAASFPARRNRVAVPIELAEPTHVGEFTDPVERQQRSQVARAQRAALARAMAELSQEDHQLIRLRYYEQLTVPLVAARLQTSPRSLYGQCERIMSQLRRRLVEQGITGVVPLDV